MPSGRPKRNRDKIIGIWRKLPTKAKEIIIGLIVGYVIFKIMLRSGILG